MLSATLSHLSRHAQSLSRIATLHLGGCSLDDDDALPAFMSAVPALQHLRLDSELAADAGLLRCVGARLKTLVAPACVVSVATAGQLGVWFRGLETLELRVRGDGDAGIAGLPWLRTARLTWCGDAGADGARFFARAVAAAPRLRVLSFVATPPRADVDVLRDICAEGVGSPELRTVVLDGWAPVPPARVDAVWRCPVLVEAPWLWVDVDMERRRQQRRRRRRQRRLKGGSATT